MKQYLIVFLLTSFYMQAMEKNNEPKELGLPHGASAYRRNPNDSMEPIFSRQKEKKNESIGKITGPNLCWKNIYDNKKVKK